MSKTTTKSTSGKLKENLPVPGHCIHIEGAREHNLKNISVDIPRDQMVVICGPSGSGKSTLAFDIVHAEGQRRYMDSLATYARQFMPQMDKPDVDKIEGLSPGISLEQQTASRNPRSIVGTVTEIYDFLRVFFARLGRMYCPTCGRPIEARASDEIIADILALGNGTRCLILAPLAEHQKGTHQDRLKKLKAEGFVRVRINGEVMDIDAVPALDKNRKHNLDLVIDRVVIKPDLRSRLADSVELALRYGQGRLLVAFQSQAGQDQAWEEVIHSTLSVCPNCRISLPALSPQLFSFNSPQGACPRCLGLGSIEYFEPALIAPNKGLSLRQGGLLPWKNPRALARYADQLADLGKRWKFTLDTPLRDFSKEAMNALFYGETPDGKAIQGMADSGLRRNWLGGSVTLDTAVPWVEDIIGENGEDNDNASGEWAEGDAAAADPPAPKTKVSASKAAKTNTADSEKKSAKAKLLANPWPGVISLLEQGMQYGEAWREYLSRYRQTMACKACNGARLRPEALAVRVGDLNIFDFCDLPVERALPWLDGLEFSEQQGMIAEPLLKELRHRLEFMNSVGLEYLTLARNMSTLSGGEAQRIRLASQLGSGLVGVTYVLDEPSIGLHPRDNMRLLGTLRSLQRRGNTVLVVEHDEATILEADHIIEMGPGSGAQGGDVVFSGTVKDLLGKADTLTARYLRGELNIKRPKKRRKAKNELVLKNVTTNNLKNLDCRIPLSVLTCVTGPSGSGKSSLVVDTLYKHLALSRGMKVENPGAIGDILGADHLEKIIIIDQTPIGRTPRSNPATYTKVLDEVRNIFAMTPDARKRGYKPGRFSFNVPGGRCEACKGDGQLCIEMHFLPDVYVTCDVCKGKRFNLETLEVRYKGLNIADVLDLTVSEARAFFENYPALARRLTVLEEVGLGYLRLGQPVLHQLVGLGATVVVIEHNTSVILAADHVLDLGPGGGERGGYIVAQGTPEEIAANPDSVTGEFLVSE